MKDELLQIVAASGGQNRKLQTLREYLQNLILRILFQLNFFEQAVFQGGTALRFLHGLKRFSEDLDFSLTPTAAAEKIQKIASELKSELTLHDYRVDLKPGSGNVISHWLKFSELMFACGLTAHRNEIISIKLEIDPRPPAGGRAESRVFNKYFPVSVRVYSLETLLTGKINAMLTRPFAKGRDYYDLFWYLSRFPELRPNLVYLENALKQFDYPLPPDFKNRWPEALLEKVGKTSWPSVQRDVELLLEDPGDLKLFSRSALKGLISSRIRKV